MECAETGRRTHLGQLEVGLLAGPARIAQLVQLNCTRWRQGSGRRHAWEAGRQGAARLGPPALRLQAGAAQLPPLMQTACCRCLQREKRPLRTSLLLPAERHGSHVFVIVPRLPAHCTHTRALPPGPPHPAAGSRGRHRRHTRRRRCRRRLHATHQAEQNAISEARRGRNNTPKEHTALTRKLLPTSGARAEWFPRLDLRDAGVLPFGAPMAAPSTRVGPRTMLLPGLVGRGGRGGRREAHGLLGRGRGCGALAAPRLQHPADGRAWVNTEAGS